MKFSYKEKAALVWSLSKNAERLEMLGRSYLDAEALFKESDLPADAIAASVDYKQVMESYERIRALMARVLEEA